MYNSTQIAPRVTNLRMTRALAATDWMDQANEEFEPNSYEDADYLNFLADEVERHERECGRRYITPGSDPWEFTCDQPKGHYPATDHSCSNPMGPDTPTFTWRNR